MAEPTYIGVTTAPFVESSPTNTSVPSGRFQVAGITAKGPLNYSEPVRNLARFVDLFGGRTAYDTVYDVARTYFQEGGAELYVTRVVGPAATNGSVTLSDGATDPADVVTVEVVDPGAHSADYQAVVSANADGTFNLSVVDSATGRVIVAFQRAESTADLAAMAMGNAAVIVRDLAGSAAKPAAGTFNFTAGSDDRDAITAAHYIAALDAHKGVRAGVAVGTPGQPADVIAQGLGEHCAATGKIGLLEAPITATIDEAAALGESLDASASYGGYLSKPFFPAIRVPDGADRTRTVSPVGYVAAHRSMTHRNLSFAAAVAGPRVKSLWNFSPVVRLDEDDVNRLNRSGINAIQSPATGAPYLNNWSSLSPEPGLFDLNVMDALNNLTVLIKDGLAPLVWRPNDGRDVLRAEAEAIVAGIMAPLVAGGWLFPSRDGEGNFTDNGYSVAVEDLHTSAQGAPYDTVEVQVAVRFSPTVRHIHVPIRKADLRSNLT